MATKIRSERYNKLAHWKRTRFISLRVTILLLWSFALTGFFTWIFYVCLVADGKITGLDLLSLFIYILLVWKNAYDLTLMVLGFIVWQRSYGPCAPLPRIKPLLDDIPQGQKKMAILLFVRHEDQEVYEHSLESIVSSLVEAELDHNQADVYLLSDSDKAESIVEENEVQWRWRQKLGHYGIEVFHRVREEKYAAKYGNFTEFIERWGAQYEYVIPLDADGAIAGHTVQSMLAIMDQHPDIGLMQTVPHIRNPETLFGTLHAYAGNSYGVLSAFGYAWINPDHGFYWGHNCIIRTIAVREVKLPHQLEGHLPNKGKMTSHDLVEGAMLSSLGWRCMLCAGYGSDAFESAPIGPIETLQRDARWCGGDIFNGVVFAPMDGLLLEARMILITSFYSYAANFILLVWTVLTLWMFATRKDFLSTYLELENGSFISYISSEPWIMMSFMITFIMLPKLLGLYMHIHEHKPHAFRLFFGDLLMGILVSPAMAFRLGIIFCRAWFGAKPWGSSSRDPDEAVPFSEVMKATASTFLIGAIGLGLIFFIDHRFIWITILLFLSLFLSPVAFYILRLPNKQWKKLKQYW